MKILSCILFLFMQVWMANAFWWLLGVEEISKPSETIADANCAKLNRSLVTDNEQDYCSTHQQTIPLIAIGIRRAIIQCQIRFDNNRWNCTTFQGDNLFGKFINDGTRETGFVNAMLASGGGLEIAAACRNENLEDCTCKITGQTGPKDGVFYTYHCDYDALAAKTAMNTFLNDNNVADNTTALRRAEIHNHNVGLQLLQNTTESCRCIGLSGTCSVQSCFYKSPDIEVLGEILKSKYDSAVRVDLDQSTNTLVPVNENAVFDENTIAHVADSPSFCTTDTISGIIGTENRECVLDPTSRRSCDIMCCDRGYTTINKEVVTQNCRFVWCCDFVCEDVIETVPSYYCNS